VAKTLDEISSLIFFMEIFSLQFSYFHVFLVFPCLLCASAFCYVSKKNIKNKIKINIKRSGKCEYIRFFFDCLFGIPPTRDFPDKQRRGSSKDEGADKRGHGSFAKIPIMKSGSPPFFPFPSITYLLFPHLFCKARGTHTGEGESE
jgi:hypothetical protein